MVLVVGREKKPFWNTSTILKYSVFLNKACSQEKVFKILTCWGFRRQWQPTPVLLPGKSHGCRSLVGCSPWGCEESDKTERLHFHFSLSCIGEGNGNPLQCSCVENRRHWGAWWAAVYGVAQSWTRLKQLSSSNLPGEGKYLIPASSALPVEKGNYPILTPSSLPHWEMEVSNYCRMVLSSHPVSICGEGN